MENSVTYRRSENTVSLIKGNIRTTRKHGSLPLVTSIAKSDADGKYRITRIRFALLLFTFAFGIAVTAPGFTTFTDDSIELKLGEITTINAELKED